jgi:flagellar protein FliJ
VARFRFTLEPVLDQRQRLEDERQRAVAAIELQRLRLEDALRRFSIDMDLQRQSQRELLAAGDLASARMQAAAIARLGAEAQRTVLELAGVHRRLESARAQLLEAVKARKAVELLKERRLEEWTTEQSRRDAAATDEIAVIQAARKEHQ